VRTVTTGWDSFLAEELEGREQAALLRRLRPFERDGAWVVTEDGRRLLNLSSNDYLGLASHPAVIDAAARATRRGAGAGSARLVTGTDPAYRELERRLSDFQGTEAALVFGSGYLANLGTIAALVGRGDSVFSDRLNHASIVDGCRLSRATIHRYGHRELDELEAQLRHAGPGRKLIVTESVFSMDGDVAPLEEIVELKERYGAALLVDEAHADGVFGPRGEGMAHELGVADGVDLHVGTFGKAFGAYGAYVAGREVWIRYLVNAARSFVFTTALPSATVGAVRAALDLVRDADEPRRKLLSNAESFRRRLSGLGVDTGASSTQIVPVLVGESETALDLGGALEAQGILAVPIRPPTVPAGAARLRFSVSALHSEDELAEAVEALAECLSRRPPLPAGPRAPSSAPGRRA
jgi:8-amino-7-oxononanoate synthase